MLKLYKNKLALNCLASDLENALAIAQASNGYALIGVLTKQFASPHQCISTIKQWSHSLNQAVSIGLGGGDPAQSQMVNEVAANCQVNHINQVFTGVNGASSVNPQALVNALVSPCGIKGKVKITTGFYSQNCPDGIVDIKTAIELVKDMGGKSLKYFPMRGLATIEEFKEVARICGQEQFGLEPTGGLSLDNIGQILQICLTAQVPLIIPHIYSSIIDKATGKTNIDQVKQFWTIARSIFG